MDQRTPAAARRPRSKDQALRRATILLEVSRRCAAMQTLDSLLQVLVEMTSRELDCDRGTLFLNDAETSELYSRVAQGGLSHEIRILNNTGLAGHVFQTGEGLITADAYADPRFNPSVDERTGYRTFNKAAKALLPKEIAEDTVIYPKAQGVKFHYLVDKKELATLIDKEWALLKSE